MEERGEEEEEVEEMGPSSSDGPEIPDRYQIDPTLPTLHTQRDDAK